MFSWFQLTYPLSIFMSLNRTPYLYQQDYMPEEHCRLLPCSQHQQVVAACTRTAVCSEYRLALVPLRLFCIRPFFFFFFSWPREVQGHNERVSFCCLSFWLRARDTKFLAACVSGVRVRECGGYCSMYAAHRS